MVELCGKHKCGIKSALRCWQCDHTAHRTHFHIPFLYDSFHIEAKADMMIFLENFFFEIVFYSNVIIFFGKVHQMKGNCCTLVFYSFKKEENAMSFHAIMSAKLKKKKVGQKTFQKYEN